ncbi:MAG: hypothetical protein AB8H80_04420 [Planctomycetota bacterium]
MVNTYVTQTPFQQRAWALAQRAHSSADRADARILMTMVEAIDDGDYDGLAELVLALRSNYRQSLGDVPRSSQQDEMSRLEKEG